MGAEGSNEPHSPEQSSGVKGSCCRDLGTPCSPSRSLPAGKFPCCYLLLITPPQSSLTGNTLKFPFLGIAVASRERLGAISTVCHASVTGKAPAEAWLAKRQQREDRPEEHPAHCPESRLAEPASPVAKGAWFRWSSDGN